MEPEPFMANLRRGTVEFCVLALVRRDAKYAAELGAELGELGLLTSEGTLYPLLSRLRRERLVETSWVESEAGPPRRYYSITPAGGQALRAFHQQWATFTAGVNRLLEEKR
jgi:PadR family transcriptional regulator, regulatory protein PadR